MQIITFVIPVLDWPYCSARADPLCYSKVRSIVRVGVWERSQWLIDDPHLNHCLREFQSSSCSVHGSISFSVHEWDADLLSSHDACKSSRNPKRSHWRETCVAPYSDFWISSTLDWSWLAYKVHKIVEHREHHSSGIRRHRAFSSASYRFVNAKPYFGWRNSKLGCTAILFAMISLVCNWHESLTRVLRWWSSLLNRWTMVASRPLEEAEKTAIEGKGLQWQRELDWSIITSSVSESSWKRAMPSEKHLPNLNIGRYGWLNAWWWTFSHDTHAACWSCQRFESIPTASLLVAIPINEGEPSRMRNTARTQLCRRAILFICTPVLMRNAKRREYAEKQNGSQQKPNQMRTEQQTEQWVTTSKYGIQHLRITSP